MGGQQSRPIHSLAGNGAASVTANTATATTTATTNNNNTNAMNSNENAARNEKINSDDDCSFPCFLFTPNKIPFLHNRKKNDPIFGSPLPDTPVMERRRRQEVTKTASTVLQQESRQKQYTNYNPSSRYGGLEKEESSNSFRIPNLIPPPNPSFGKGSTGIRNDSGTTNTTLHHSFLQQNGPPPQQQSYPEAEIYDGDDCEERLHAKYELCEVLGVGSTSTVHRCRHKQTGMEYACKIIDIHNMDAQYHSMMIQFHTEITSLKSIHHPGIIQLYDVYILSTLKIYIVMELMLGGELFDYVVEKGTLSEEEASQIVRTVLSAVHYLHNQNIIHRDLKPENLLLKYKPNAMSTNSSGGGDSNNKNSSNHKNGKPAHIDVKIIDFGLSKLMETTDTVASTFLGTRGYLAPEMLQRREYTRAVDAWAMGVIVFVLLCGCLPFDDDSATMPNDDLILQKRFVLRFPRWAKNLSASARDLLNHLLDINPITRYTAEQALYHPWVQGETAPSNKLLASPGRIRKSPAVSTNKKINGVNVTTSNYLGRKYAPDPSNMTPPAPRVRKGSF